jgi:transcriptional regulator with XRE-family HTH domain
MDGLGETICRRVKDLLRARPDVEPAQFFRAIGRPTPSWQSEFMNGRRTTNDLRLVVRMAKFFGVSLAYLIGQDEATIDAGAATVLATWQALETERDRALFLQVAATFRTRASGPSNGAPNGDLPAEEPSTRPRSGVPRKRKQR